MSYDVVLQRFEHGDAAVAHSAEIWALLEDAWDAPPDQFNYCRVRRSGDEGDLYAVQPGEPIDSLMFNHAGSAIYHLMFDVAVAGDMVIIPPDVGPFLVRDEQRAHLPAGFAGRATVVRSGVELAQAIEEA